MIRKEQDAQVIKDGERHRELAKSLGGELYGWNGPESCTVRINGVLYTIEGPIYKALATARLAAGKYREAAKLKSRLVHYDRDDDFASIRIDEKADSLLASADAMMKGTR